MSFRGFLEELRGAGLIQDVHEPVSPVLEVANRSMSEGPIFFHNVDGHKCCLNILDNRALLARALGIQAKDLVKYLGSVEYNGQVKEVNSSAFQEVVSQPTCPSFPF